MRTFQKSDINTFLSKLKKISHNEPTSLLLYWHFGGEISKQLCIEYVKEFDAS